MAQDSVSPASFFDVSSSKYGDSNSTVNGNRPEEAPAASREFSSALHQAAGQPGKPLNGPSLDGADARDREFFSHKPFPRHDSADISQNRGAAPVQSKHVSRVDSQEESQNVGDDGQDSGSINTEDNGWQSRDPSWSRMQPDVDDRNGVVGQSYNGAAVSYPVSRIAKESLDKKTKEALEKQGLWNLPTVVMAQPTQQLMSFKNVVGQKNALPVQKPIAQFMASLENELGVTPDRLVQALQNLPPGALQLSPEKTMALVVKQLGLKGTDQTKAMALYSKMLTQLRAVNGGDKMLAANLPAGLAALEKAQSVNKMEAQNEASGRIKTDQASHFGKAVDGKMTAHKAGKETVVASQNDDVASSLVKTDGKAVKTDAFGKNADQTGALSQNAKGQTDQNDFFSRSQNQSQNFLSQNHQGMKQDQASLKNLGKDDAKFDLKNDLHVDAKTDKPLVDVSSGVNQASNQSTDLRFQNGAPAISGTAAAEMKSDAMNSKHQAIQSIVNNAQMLANKGGGEMHMTLKPEHLGEIQLKVAMNGNHVNVQMVTDRGEVKKLIEQSVHELRHGLAQHDLSMNKLEVSVGDKSTGGMKQGMPDFSAAREFAGQFHQQQGRREMLNDLASLNTARSGLGQSDGLKATGSAARSQAYARSSAPGRLNVVA